MLKDFWNRYDSDVGSTYGHSLDSDCIALGTAIMPSGAEVSAVRITRRVGRETVERIIEVGDLANLVFGAPHPGQESE